MEPYNYCFEATLDLIADRRSEPLVLCELGCGTGQLLAYIRKNGFDNIAYIGVDPLVSDQSHLIAEFPRDNFVDIDVIAPNANLDPIKCDFLVISRLSLKDGATAIETWSLLESTIRAVWSQVRWGLVFTVRPEQAGSDHIVGIPMQRVAALLHELAGRRIRLRSVYGSSEYTAYAWKSEVPVALLVTPGSEHKPLESVPVLRPMLPSAEKLLPYLRRIDAARIFTNFGPLVVEFENRLTLHLGMPSGGLVSASSGTAALVGAILASAGRATPERPFALIPAFTFVATAVAVEQCGYHVCLADVDAETWMLDARKVGNHPEIQRVGVVIPVGPFGRPVSQAPWQTFRDKTGIPVVIDGAASFEAISDAPERYLGEIPVMVSFHATKSFATGEGGCVLSTDVSLIARTGQALNFGFYATRNSLCASTNGKMSEYHAAVGLAELDEWDVKKTALRAVGDCYQRLLSRSGLANRCLTAPDVCSSYIVFRCVSAVESLAIQDSLRRNGIEFRLWYGTGLQHQLYFSDSVSESLLVTEQIAPCLLGLPMAQDLGEGVIERVVAALNCGLAGT